MAKLADLDETTKLLVLSREEAVKIIHGLTAHLADVGTQGIPEVIISGFGYRMAFVVGRNE